MNILPNFEVLGGDNLEDLEKNLTITKALKLSHKNQASGFVQRDWVPLLEKEGF